MPSRTAMAVPSLRAGPLHLKVEIARRWRRRRAVFAAVDWRKLIPAMAMATTAVSVLLLTCSLPRHPDTSLPFLSVSSSYATDQNVAPAVPLPSLPPSPSLLVTPRQSPSPLEASVFSLSPPDPAVSSPHKSPPVGNFAPKGRVGEEKSSVRSSRSSRSKRPLRSLPPHEALAYAKSQIQRAPLISDDPDLHPPLFRNVSIFRRTYELMEKTLKVYIYKDGEKPIFHRPPRKGIYASEGWFMKLMEENKQFVVRNPNRAHLFYLPYSTRQLQETLYVPESHNIRPLSLFLRDYVNMIAAKYSFWNRTHGSDHFLVACHDWGPYVTRAHNELRRNSIKALCNADTSEGIFIRGKDVSLPETTIRTPRRPLKDLGGKPISQRSILAFYAGQMHGRVRPILHKYWGGKDEDMKIYGPLPVRVSRVMSYIQHMKSSRFCICPMGYEVNSPRIVEAIYYECVPVIIADNFVPPFDEVLNWSSFSVIVAEKDIPDLKSILLSISIQQYMFLQTNVKRLQKHFLWHARPVKYDLFHMILHSLWFNRLNQIQIQH
uniref:Putative glycosyltransferase At5g03795 n=1 Tax=Anthurium amnicola TaxID=1678845 RepID=A0A1D1XGQ7_9ARAE